MNYALWNIILLILDINWTKKNLSWFTIINKYIYIYLENNFIHPFPQIRMISIRLSNEMGRRKKTFNILYLKNMLTT